MESNKRKQGAGGEVPPGAKAPAVPRAKAPADDTSWCVKCTRATEFVSMNDAVYENEEAGEGWKEASGRKHKQLSRAVKATDGAWHTGAPQKPARGGGGPLLLEPHVLPTLEAANTHAAQVWQAMLECPPRACTFTGESDWTDEEQDARRTAAQPQPGDRSESADGRVRFSRKLEFYYDPEECMPHRIDSSIAVEVVRVRRGWVACE